MKVENRELSSRAAIDALLQSSYQQRVVSLKEAIRLASTAHKQAVAIAYHEGVAWANSHLALYYMVTGQVSKANNHVMLAKGWFEQHNNQEGLAETLYTLGSLCYKSDDYYKGIKYLQQCLDLNNTTGNVLGQSRALKAIGYIYELFNDHDNAIEAYQRCIELSKSIRDTNGESNAYSPLAGLYLSKGDIPNATATINKAIALKETTGDKRGLAYALLAKGNVELVQVNYKAAEANYFRSLSIHLEMGDNLGTVMTYSKLAAMYCQQKLYTQSEQYSQLTLETGQKMGNNILLHEAYHTLYLIEKARGNSQLAIVYLEQSISYQNKVNSISTLNLIKSQKTISKIESLEREARLMREKNKQIEEKNRELDTFVYRVSHDLRGPVSSLLGLHNIVQNEIKDPDALMYFKMYHRQISRLNKVLSDLINFTRIKEVKPQHNPIDFNRLVQECLEAYSYVPNYRNIKFELNIDPQLEFYSDESILNSILQNLLENAMKYIRGNVVPCVTVTIQEDAENQQLNIIVADNGIGIEPEYQVKVFEMFFRANDTIDGTGLGLYIFKNAVDKLGGNITLNSQVGQGSTFHVRLPINKRQKFLGH